MGGDWRIVHGAGARLQRLECFLQVGFCFEIEHTLLSLAPRVYTWNLL